MSNINFVTNVNTDTIADSRENVMVNADTITNANVKNNTGINANIKIDIANSASSGLSLKLGGTIVWVDAIHARKTSIYSTVTPEIWDYMKKSPAFIGLDGHGPDMIAFTHCHTDHFDAFMCREAKSLWPHTRLALPERYFPEQTLIEGERQAITVNDVTIEYIRSIHSGKDFADYPSYFINIDYRGIHILISGDTSVNDKSIPEYCADKRPDIAFMNYSWILFGKGRSIIDERLCPRHLFVTHAPFENDDTKNVLRSVRNGISFLKETEDVTILCEPRAEYSVTI